MARCKYCGKSAWLFRWKHKVCEEIYEKGKHNINKIIYDWFFSFSDMMSIKKSVIQLAKESYISPKELDEICIFNYNKIVKQFLYDGIITPQEETKLTEFKDVFNFDQEFLDQQGLFEKFIKAVIVRDIIEGKMPAVDFDLDSEIPLSLAEWEKVIRLFDDVELYEKKIFNNLNFWYGTDSWDELFFSSIFSSDFIETKNMKLLQYGTLIVTNKDTYFIYDDWVAKINVKNLSSMTPYQDWFWFKPKDKKGTFHVFKNLDWWFAYNVMFNLNRSFW